MIAWATAFVSQSIAANATNYLSYNVRSLISGTDVAVSSGTFTGGVGAGAETDLAVAYDEAAVRLAAGDIGYFRISAVGTGGTAHGLAVAVHYMDYATS